MGSFSTVEFFLKCWFSEWFFTLALCLWDGRRGGFFSVPSYQCGN